MKVAVCCPGQSLPHRWPGDYAYAGVWAVNTALIVVDADYFAAGDITSYKLVGDRRPRLGCIVMDKEVKRLAELGWNGLEIITWRGSALIGEHHEKRHVNWSVQTALLHAAEIGAKHIDLFGCDGIHSKTVTDCTGYNGDYRTEERWKREEKDLAFTFDFLRARGCEVLRCPP